jgi:hypothetical protein
MDSHPTLLEMHTSSWSHDGTEPDSSFPLTSNTAIQRGQRSLSSEPDNLLELRLRNLRHCTALTPYEAFHQTQDERADMRSAGHRHCSWKKSEPGSCTRCLPGLGVSASGAERKGGKGVRESSLDVGTATAQGEALGRAVMTRAGGHLGGSPRRGNLTARLNTAAHGDGNNSSCSQRWAELELKASAIGTRSE